MYSVIKVYRSPAGEIVEKVEKTGMTYADAYKYCGDRGCHVVETLPDGIEDEVPIGGPAYLRKHRVYTLDIREDQ